MFASILEHANRNYFAIVKRGSVQKSDRTKERHNERATKIKRATARKSDSSNERHNKRATKLPKFQFYSFGSLQFFSIDNIFNSVQVKIVSFIVRFLCKL